MTSAKLRACNFSSLAVALNYRLSVLQIQDVKGPNISYSIKLLGKCVENHTFCPAITSGNNTKPIVCHEYIASDIEIIMTFDLRHIIIILWQSTAVLSSGEHNYFDSGLILSRTLHWWKASLHIDVLFYIKYMGCSLLFSLTAFSEALHLGCINISKYLINYLNPGCRINVFPLITVYSKFIFALPLIDIFTQTNYTIRHIRPILLM